MSSVEISILEGCAVVTTTPQGEESQQFKEVLGMALDMGYAQLQDEYFDKELDRYVYVFTPMEDQ